MAAYPYTGRDLLAQREPYSYSQCVEPGFLEAWRSSRQEAAGRIVTGASAQQACVSERIDGTTLADWLASVASDCCAGGADAAYERIEPLVHKFEVFRRLFSSYGADFRRLPSAQPASVTEYLQFGECLASIAERNGPFQALSTLLKLADSLCSQPGESFTREEAARLARLVARERALVEKLASC
jgi:hypothetical protein